MIFLYIFTLFPIIESLSVLAGSFAMLKALL
jgi:hypothetical protein